MFCLLPFGKGLLTEQQFGVSAIARSPKPNIDSGKNSLMVRQNMLACAGHIDHFIRRVISAMEKMDHGGPWFHTQTIHGAGIFTYKTGSLME